MKTNDPLLLADILPSYFTGYFAAHKSKSGCDIYVSCSDEEHANETKEKLKQFLNNQQIG